MVLTSLGSRYPILTPLAESPPTSGATAYSLYFDGVGDWVDCGNDPSVMDLHAGANGFTIDVYWMCPDMVAVPNGTIMGLAAQGRWGAQGWALMVQKSNATTAFFYFGMKDGGGTWRSIFRQFSIPATGTWFYVRARRDSGGTIYLSVDAGTQESLAVTGATTWTENFKIAHCHVVGGQVGYGNITYVHVWNADQGALGSVPSTSFSLGANTAARYRLTDGAGTILTDDSGNDNNGDIINAVWQEVAPPGWTP